MKKLITVASQLLFASSLYAGGSSSGTPPARTVDDMLNGQIKDLPGIDLGKDRIEQLLGNLPSKDLIKTPDDRTLIPISPENIRRLNMRTSTGLEAAIKTDAGETFKVKPVDEKLVDLKKAAEVVERAEEETPLAP